jgi:hypothetical protein
MSLVRVTHPNSFAHTIEETVYYKTTTAEDVAHA